MDSVIVPFPHTPAGSWVLPLQALRTVSRLRPSGPGSAPACSLLRRTRGIDAAGFLFCTDRSPACPPKGTLSRRFDSWISPPTSHQLQSCLAITPAGLSPASPSQHQDTRQRSTSANPVPGESSAYTRDEYRTYVLTRNVTRAAAGPVKRRPPLDRPSRTRPSARYAVPNRLRCGREQPAKASSALSP